MKHAEITIAGRKIGVDHPPFIIAEMSGNHGGSLDRALAIVDAVSKSGADALKLQTYTADSLTLNVDAPDFRINDPSSLWTGRRLYELYQEACTPYEWMKPIFERAQANGLICFSSPFDAHAVDLLQSLDAPAYKIASFEIVDLELIATAARTGKPIIISTGMSTISEIEAAVDAAYSNGASEIALLKCTSTYPASARESNLASIQAMKEVFNVPIGLSDHTLGIGAAVASVALGACIIEKHVTESRADGGVDSAFSLEPPELASLVLESRRAWEAIGSIKFGPTEGEKNSLQFRRSLYVCAPVSAGEPLTRKNIRAVRPGFGLAPHFLPVVLGRRVSKDLEPGMPLLWEHLA